MPFSGSLALHGMNPINNNKKRISSNKRQGHLSKLGTARCRANQREAFISKLGK